MTGENRYVKATWKGTERIPRRGAKGGPIERVLLTVLRRGSKKEFPVAGAVVNVKRSRQDAQWYLPNGLEVILDVKQPFILSGIAMTLPEDVKEIFKRFGVTKRAARMSINAQRCYIGQRITVNFPETAFRVT